MAEGLDHRLRDLRGSKGLDKRTMPSQLTRLNSRMSFKTHSRVRLESRAVSTQSRCSAVSSVVDMIWSMPRMPFKGVRSSWLMLARNSDLASSRGRFALYLDSCRRTRSSAFSRRRASSSGAGGALPPREW